MTACRIMNLSAYSTQDTYILLQAFILEMNGYMWCARKDESLVLGHKCEGRGTQGLSGVGG